MQQLQFLREIHDVSKRTEYLQTLLRMVALEKEQGPGWQITQTEPPESPYTWMYAKTGYVNKLENEGVVIRTRDSNQYTQYRLAVPHEALLDMIRRSRSDLDNEHQDLLERVAQRTT